MRASKQTYLGRVIFPAKYVEATRPFLSFVLYVDNHVVSGKERSSARISCNYTLPKDAENDEVSVILSRIFSKDDPDSGGLNGQQYKSVDVLVEGDEKLVAVEGKPGAVYKNLEYCRVQIVDKGVRALFRQENSKNSESEESEEEVERPTTTPAGKTRATTTKAQTQPERTAKSPEPTKGYKVGQIVEAKGKKYKFLGGAVDSGKSWELVKEEEEDEGVPPFMQEASESKKDKSSTKSSLRGFLAEADDDLEFSESDDLPV